MAETPAVQLKTEVKAFWNRQACGTEHVRADKFSRDYFEQLEARRYQFEPFIHSFAQFTRYHGKRVLEVGFGPGTDFVQWLRAGAVASGVDLTEEALDHLTHRIQVYGLPEPESLQVADAEHLPFESNTFHLGYSWGVLHHTPDTEASIRELVRVVRPGGEIKIMLYNRYSLCALKCWGKYALLRGRPWKSLSWALWNHVESIGTKGYTRAELHRMLSLLGLTDIKVETYATSADRIERKAFPLQIINSAFGLLLSLSGNRLGWFHGVVARKP
jgi:ubiquinone/menaquinone biosynthesis C-methylase UbiE